MIILKVSFMPKTQLPEEEHKKILEEVVNVFKQVPGLKQKYFLKNPRTGEAGGIYVFESQEALDKYLRSDVWRDVVLANAQGEPVTETLVVKATTDVGVIK